MNTPLNHAGYTLVAAALLWCSPLLPAPAAAKPSGQDQLAAVVQVDTMVPGDARTASGLGTRRQGSGVVIDEDGLILTIGYVILEAMEVTVRDRDGEAVPASIIAYDHESGFGLIRAQSDLGIEPITLGDPAGLDRMEPLLVVSRVGELSAAGVYLVDRRPFAGYWEYLLEEALFTAPAHRQFGGAALLDRHGQLVGIGSLLVRNSAPEALGRGRETPGNMFIPVSQLEPILADLLSQGRRSDPPHPWHGLYLEEYRGRVFVTRVAPEGPAEAAGLGAGALILGVGGQPISGLADFYRKLWGVGDAGVEVPLDIAIEEGVQSTVIKSGNRYRYLRLDPTF
jgi:S1-C subfamily serine protease